MIQLNEKPDWAPLPGKNGSSNRCKCHLSISVGQFQPSGLIDNAIKIAFAVGVVVCHFQYIIVQNCFVLYHFFYPVPILLKSLSD